MLLQDSLILSMWTLFKYLTIQWLIRMTQQRLGKIGNFKMKTSCRQSLLAHEMPCCCCSSKSSSSCSIKEILILITNNPINHNKQLNNTKTSTGRTSTTMVAAFLPVEGTKLPLPPCPPKPWWSYSELHLGIVGLSLYEEIIHTHTHTHTPKTEGKKKQKNTTQKKKRKTNKH